MKTPVQAKPKQASAIRAKTTMLAKPKLHIDHHQHCQQEQCPKLRLAACAKNYSSSSGLDLSNAEAALWNLLERRRRHRLVAARRQAMHLPEIIATPTGKVWRKTAGQFVYRDSNAKLLHVIPDEQADDDDATASKAASTMTVPRTATESTPATSGGSAAALAGALRCPAPLQYVGRPMGAAPSLPPARFLVRPRFPSEVR